MLVFGELHSDDFICLLDLDLVALCLGDRADLCLILSWFNTSWKKVRNSMINLSMNVLKHSIRGKASPDGASLTSIITMNAIIRWHYSSHT